MTKDGLLIGRACSTYRSEEKSFNSILLTKPEGERAFEMRCINGRIILKWTLKEIWFKHAGWLLLITMGASDVLLLR
jgi:hypothetical protein